jgi:hypothetical protein
MNFFDAMVALQAGKKIRRPLWKTGFYYVKQTTPRIVGDKDLPLVTYIPWQEEALKKEEAEPVCHVIYGGSISCVSTNVSGHGGSVQFTHTDVISDSWIAEEV